MSQRDWDSLTHIEQCFFINAKEHDILPGVFGDLEESERRLPLDQLAGILLPLINRGWIEARRYARWISEEGLEGLSPGDMVPRAELPQVLADPANWEYPDDQSWIGTLSLVCTEAGLAISRGSPQEVAAEPEEIAAETAEAGGVS